MTISPEAQQRINSRKQLTDQFIRDPEFLIPGLFVEPWTEFYRTNNFVQQTLGRMYGFHEGEKHWHPISIDDDHRIILSDQSTSGVQVLIKNRNFTDAVVIDNQSVPNAAAISHAALDISSFGRKSMLVSSDGPVTIYVQFSDDELNWYEWYDTSDNAVTFAVDNVKKCIEIIDVAHYMRIVITNSSGAAVNVTAVIEGQA